MKNKSNISNLMKETGLNKSTISRVLNNYKYISEEAKKRKYAIDEIDYRINLNARNIARNKTNLIVIVVSEINNSFFANIYFLLYLYNIMNY